MEEHRKRIRARLLLIDGDESIVSLFIRMMRCEDYKIYVAKDGKQGKEMSTSICPDLILMDIALGDVDGIEMIRWFREWTDAPVFVISERSSCADKTQALYAGADDYIVKPFHEQELVARIYTALRRRIPCGKDAFYRAGNLEIDFGKRLVTRGGEEIYLSPVEYRIVEYLALHAGAVVTYQMLMEKIWGPYVSSGSRILRVNMTNIRKKLEEIPAEPVYITTIPRVGYRMLENQSEVPLLTGC